MLRSRGIGASEIAAIVGLDPFRAPIDVWRTKVEGLRTPDTPHTKRGRYLESALLRWYADETGNRVRPGVPCVHPAHPVVLATPDFLVLDEVERCTRVGEIKAPSWRAAREWEEDGVPDRYICQVQQQMAVIGVAHADIAAYLDDRLVLIPVELDAELAATLVDAAERFWSSYVLTRVPPPPDASRSYSSWLRQRFRDTRGDYVTATPQAELWAERLRLAKARLTAAEADEREARNHLQALIGQADGLIGRFGRICWRHNRAVERTDWEALARAKGSTLEEIAQFTVKRPGPRVFRVSWEEEI